MKRALLAYVMVACIGCGAQILGPILFGGGSGPLTIYYIAASGNDSNTGLSPAQAWQTITKVNAHSCAIGDAFYFNGGDTFTGTLTLGCSGTKKHPITYSSYGTGQGIISSSTGDGIDLGNYQDVTVDNLNLVGVGWTGTGSSIVSGAFNMGVHGVVTSTTGAKLSNITISNNTISGYFLGIFLDTGTAANPSPSASLVGYNNIQISGNTLSNNLSFGFVIEGYNTYGGGPTNQNTNISVISNTMTNIPGDPNSGNGGVDGPWKTEATGIVVGNVTGATINGNYITYVGGYGGYTSGLSLGGSTGLVFAASRVATIHGNEVGYVNCSTKFDGSGIDIDIDSQSTDVAYNLTYYNVGPGIQSGGTSGHASTGNYIHDNISYDDVRGNNTKSVAPEQGAFRLWGYSQSNYWYNNTIFLSSPLLGTSAAINFETGNNDGNIFSNNILKTSGAVPLFHANSSLDATHLGTQTIVGNLYDSSGFALQISNDTGAAYVNVTTLAAWQADGYETYSSVNYGSTGPAYLLTNPPFGAFTIPTGGFIANGGLPAFNFFDPVTGSAAIASGINPSLVGGPNIIGTQDWHGTTITGSPFNMGAVSTTNTTVADSPEPSPVNGVAFENIPVTWSCLASGCYICYTQDGSTPITNGSGGCTHGTLYSSGYTITASETDKAVTGASGYTQSAVSTIAYTLSTLVWQIPMSDGSGTTATDACCGDNLTITPGAGGWTTQAGIANGVYNFDGVATTGTRMDAANNANLNFNYNQPFSVFMAMDFTSTSAEMDILGNLDATNNYRGWEIGFTWVSSAYHPRFALINTYPTNCVFVSTLSATIGAGSVYDIVETYDGSGASTGVKIYIDGNVQVNGSPVCSNLTTTTTNSKLPRLGMRLDGTGPFKGKMGPIYVWNRVLTSTEAAFMHSNYYSPPN